MTLFQKMGYGEIVSHTDYAQYSFMVGDRHSFSGEFVRNKKMFYNVGDKIDVYYNPANPIESCTHRDLEEDKSVNRFFIFLFTTMMALTVVSAVVLAVFHL